MQRHSTRQAWTDSKYFPIDWNALQAWEQKQVLWRRYMGYVIDYHAAHNVPVTPYTYEYAQERFNEFYNWSCNG